MERAATMGAQRSSWANMATSAMLRLAVAAGRALGGTREQLSKITASYPGSGDRVCAPVEPGPGAVFGWESYRLARSSADLFRLLELSRLACTVGATP